ncbi:hypothetical protein D3C76_1726700 [compost metagenome]
MTDHGQLQLLHSLIGGWVGEELVQGAYRVRGIDLLDAQALQFVPGVAELVAQAGRGTQ